VSKTSDVLIIGGGIIGGSAQRLAPAQIQSHPQELRVDDLLGGTFCADGGSADPHGLLQRYLGRARSRGLEVLVRREVVGIIKEGDRFYVVCGFSGHGFMPSPAIGILMTEILLDGRATSMDIEPLSLARFGAGPVPAEANMF